MRRTKIVCTLGPATQTDEQIEALIQAGMDVARLNFSHGTQAGHAEQIERVRRVAARLERPVAVLQDLQGPKIRTGQMAAGPVTLRAGERFVLTTREVAGDGQQASTTYKGLPGDVHAGDQILLADGAVQLVVESIAGEDVVTRVLHGGPLGAHKGINLPGVAVSAPALTEKDRKDLAFGLARGVDYVALSFVRRPEDVAEARALIAGAGAPARLIAKLEKPQALDNLEAIVELADGVMVARGDLGVELSPQEVPTAQKRIIAAANRAGRLVITATQMLESMITSPSPTRAEASDVANAIYDGTDAIMLSGETAVGAYPVESVAMMALIAREAEGHLDEWGRHRRVREDTHDDALAIARAARDLADERDAAAIAAFTRSGRTALLLSKQRPDSPVLAFTPDDTTFRQMALFWGTLPCRVPESHSVEQMIARVEQVLLSHDQLGGAGALRGARVVFVAGFPVGDRPAPTNFIKLHRVGEEQAER
jgi:pyruvate kinase